MAKFCTGCGKALEEGKAFCTECGMPVPATNVNTQEKPKANEEKVTQAAQQPPVQTDSTVMQQNSSVTGEEKVTAAVQQPTVQNNSTAVRQESQNTTAQNQAKEHSHQQSQQTYTQPQTAYIPVVSTGDNEPPKGKYGPVSTGTYFWLFFLFAIPVIGWIACIICAFAPKNVNIKHFARALLINLIIALIICGILALVIMIASNTILSFISESTGQSFNSWQDIINQFQ